MRTYNVVFVLGTEPAAASMAPLVLAMRNQPDLRPVVVVTGAEHKALEKVLGLFAIAPDFTVNIGWEYHPPSQYRTTSSSGLDDLLDERPDVVLVQPDTDTSLATTLAAFFHRVPVIQVGDALPSGDTGQHPDELHSRLASRLCAMHLVSTPRGAQRLWENGVPADAIVCIGDPAVESFSATQAVAITHSDHPLDELERDGGRISCSPGANAGDDGLAAHRALGAIRHFLGIGPEPDGLDASIDAARCGAAELLSTVPTRWAGSNAVTCEIASAKCGQTRSLY